MFACRLSLRRCYVLLTTVVLTIGYVEAVRSADVGQYVNIALDRYGGTVTASDQWASDKGPENLIDGECNPGNEFHWCSAWQTQHPHWIHFRFAKKCPVSKIVLYANDAAAFPTKVRLERQKADGTFAEIATRDVAAAKSASQPPSPVLQPGAPPPTVLQAGAGADSKSVAIEFPPVATDNVRLVILGSGGKAAGQNPAANQSQLAEVEIYAEMSKSQLEELIHCPLARQRREVTVTLDARDSGRAFDGIGGVSAGASSRLLIDYPEPYRSDVLDYLFKPKFGASFQHLKVEIGGGLNSTCGAEPSHARTRQEVANPVSRGYEFWLMSEARKRSPKIMLDCLPWCFPHWLSQRFSADTADYFVAFLKVAKEQWGLDMNYVSAAHNEAGTSLDWILHQVRPALDRAGFAQVKIETPDGGPFWLTFNDFERNPAYAKVIDAVGDHYVDWRDGFPSQKIIDSGKRLWGSEDWWDHGETWQSTRIVVERMNRYYIKGRMTQIDLWAPIASAAEGMNDSETGVMKANTPWSGFYKVRPAVWGVAHYTQFTEPGWVFLDNACGKLSRRGNYAALRKPGSGDYSVIIYADRETKLTFKLTGGLSTGPVHVWKSNKDVQFVQERDVVPAGDLFTVVCEPDSVYSLTTTTGQQKGQPPHPIPSAKPFPYPYRADFEDGTVGTTYRYLSDGRGTFEVARCRGGRPGKCLEQMVPQAPNESYLSGERELNVLSTVVPFDPSHGDYEAKLDVLIEKGSVFLAARKGIPHWLTGYALVLRKDGSWQILYDHNSRSMEPRNTPIIPPPMLASGKVAAFDGNVWHALKLRCMGPQIEAYIDGVRVATIRDTRRIAGQVCFGCDYAPNQFDNVSVEPIRNRSTAK